MPRCTTQTLASLGREGGALCKLCAPECPQRHLVVADLAAIRQQLREQQLKNFCNPEDIVYGMSCEMWR